MLKIITPEETLFSGSVEYASFPGEQGSFAILRSHASLLSSLVAGTVMWVAEGKKESVYIKGGFVEVLNNIVTVCVEI